MRRIAALAALAALLATSCTTVPRPDRRQTTQPVATSTGSLPVSPAAPAPATEDVVLPRLPLHGVVVEDRHGLVFVGVDGHVAARVRRFGIENPTEAPGRVLVRRHRTVYVLRVHVHLPHPLKPWRVDRFHAPDDPGLDIPPPHGSTTSGGRVTGHWRWARFSPDLSWVLAQWSGECEVPTATMVPSDGKVPTPVTGEWGLTHAPESEALGWSADGRAVVLLPEAACGAGLPTPGVYLFTAPGEATLLVPVHGYRSARMWGTA